LKPADEVIIIDDGSRDDTVDRITRMGDARIRLFKHEKNAGVVATFEDALRSASGDILFLCDDDDIWAPTKAQRFLDVFESRRDVEIVLSRVRMIDESDRPMPNSRINRNGRFLPGFWRNLFMNHYQGSAMAIRASLLGRVLPGGAAYTYLPASVKRFPPAEGLVELLRSTGFGEVRFRLLGGSIVALHTGVAE